MRFLNAVDVFGVGGELALVLFFILHFIVHCVVAIDIPVFPVEHRCLWTLSCSAFLSDIVALILATSDHMTCNSIISVLLVWKKQTLCQHKLNFFNIFSITLFFICILGSCWCASLEELVQAHFLCCLCCLYCGAWPVRVCFHAV